MSLLHKVINRIAREPAVTLGVVVAAINTAADHTWQGYATAIGIALVRFAVTPIVEKKG